MILQVQTQAVLQIYQVLAVSITPSATSSKILYTGSLYLGFTGAEGNLGINENS